MKDYSLTIEKEMQQARQEEATKFNEARNANETSDTYLLLTVIFTVPWRDYRCVQETKNKGHSVGAERNNDNLGSNLFGLLALGKRVRRDQI